MSSTTVPIAAAKHGSLVANLRLVRAPLAVAPFLAASALLPGDAPIWCALAAIIILGVPHGALDGEVARDLLRPRFGRAWFAVFAVPYLALSTAVLLAWRFAPLTTTASFLVASVVHFGIEESASSSWLERIARGGLPIALPSLFHPAATADLFAAVSAHPLPALPGWWLLGDLTWMAVFVLWSVQTLRCGVGGTLIPLALVAFGFLALLPLTAFALYFICIHAPAHMAGMITDPRRARRVSSTAAAWRLATPLALLTLLLGALLWPLYDGTASLRLLALTIQGLAALTLPHMLLEMSHEHLRARLGFTISHWSAFRR